MLSSKEMGCGHACSFNSLHLKEPGKTRACLRSPTVRSGRCYRKETTGCPGPTCRWDTKSSPSPSGSVDLLTTSLKVSVDAPPEPIRVLLAVDGNPWVKVSGRVTNLGSNRTLMLTGPNVDQIQLTVNPDGTFEIPQALPGTYQIRPNISSSTSPSLVMQPISVVIPNQDTTNLVIPLPLTKDVPGIVVNTSGAGVQGRLSLSYSQTSATSSSSGSRSHRNPARRQVHS